MSYTEIFVFTEDGTASYRYTVRNAWRFGMAIWVALEDKYLPPYRPDWVPAYIPDHAVEAYCHYKPRRILAPGLFADKTKRKPQQDVWDLFDDERVCMTDKIVLGTTFDNVLVRRDDLPRVIEAYEAFEGETSLKEQAEILRKLLADDTCTAVGWNGTSVCADNWFNAGGYDEENDEEIPYNYLTMDKHWWLFDELEAACGE